MKKKKYTFILTVETTDEKPSALAMEAALEEHWPHDDEPTIKIKDSQ